MAKKKRVSQPIPKERLHPPGGVNTEDAGGIFLEERVFHERRDGVASVIYSAKVASLADMGAMELLEKAQRAKEIEQLSFGYSTSTGEATWSAVRNGVKVWILPQPRDPSPGWEPIYRIKGVTSVTTKKEAEGQRAAVLYVANILHGPHRRHEAVGLRTSDTRGRAALMD